MAYTDDEYKATVHGVVGDSELWVNTWSFLNITEADPVFRIVQKLRQFYDDLLEIMCDQWQVTGITVRNLGTEVSSDPTYEEQVGASGNDLLPTQLAVRVSLDDLIGHRGGPFLSGWQTGSVTTNGLLEPSHQAIVSTAVDDLAQALEDNGMQLRIDRPTALTTVGALRSKVGQRFDVIRKRSNDTPESYIVADLS